MIWIENRHSRIEVDQFQRRGKMSLHFSYQKLVCYQNDRNGKVRQHGPSPPRAVVNMDHLRPGRWWIESQMIDDVIAVIFKFHPENIWFLVLDQIWSFLQLVQDVLDLYRSRHSYHSKELSVSRVQYISYLLRSIQMLQMIWSNRFSTRCSMMRTKEMNSIRYWWWNRDFHHHCTCTRFRDEMVFSSFNELVMQQSAWPITQTNDIIVSNMSADIYQWHHGTTRRFIWCDWHVIPQSVRDKVDTYSITSGMKALIDKPCQSDDQTCTS